MALIATDLIGFRLPDLLTGALVPIALMLAWTTGFPGLEMALLGGMIGAGSFGILRLGYRRLRRREGLGLGDVKLMAGLGAALGPHDLRLLPGLQVARPTAFRQPDPCHLAPLLPPPPACYGWRVTCQPESPLAIRPDAADRATRC